MHSLRKLLGYCRRADWQAIARGIRQRIPPVVWRTRLAFIFEGTATGRQARSAEIDLLLHVEARVIRRSEMRQVALVSGLPVEECYRRLDAGDVCFGALKAGRLGTVSWIHRGACYIRGMGYLHEAGPDTAYVYGAVTEASQRRQGLYRHCLARMEEFLINQGCTRLVRMVEAGNQPVLHTLSKRGFRITKTLRHRTLLGMRRTNILDHDQNRSTTMTTWRAPTRMFRI